jgi:hypothetical protein
MTTTLYRYYDDAGQLLYVGIANNPLARQSQHRKAAPWWHRASRQRLQHFPTRADAEEAERLAIQEELPLYNRAVQLTQRQRKARVLWQQRGRWDHRRVIRAARRAALEESKLRHSKADSLWRGRAHWEHRVPIRERRQREEAARAEAARAERLTRPGRRYIGDLPKADRERVEAFLALGTRVNLRLASENRPVAGRNGWPYGVSWSEAPDGSRRPVLDSDDARAIWVAATRYGVED